VRSATESHGDSEKEVHVLTANDLARAARIALDRVESVMDSPETVPDCRVDHIEIARVGIEEGLKLAIRVLRQQSEPSRTLDLDRTAHDQSPELPYPTPGISRSLNGR
jgi:hypothetical protein